MVPQNDLNNHNKVFFNSNIPRNLKEPFPVIFANHTLLTHSHIHNRISMLRKFGAIGLVKGEICQYVYFKAQLDA